MAAEGKRLKLPPLTTGARNHRHTLPSNRTTSRYKSNSSIASTYSFQMRSSNSAEETSEKAAETLMHLCDLLRTKYMCRYNKIRRANDVIITCLVRKTLRERLEIQCQFKQLYAHDLSVELKESLGQEYGGVVDGLLQSPYGEVAAELHQLIEDLDPYALVDKLLLCGRRCLACVCADYRKKFGVSLIADTQRSFGDPRVSRLLAALMRGLLWPAPFTAGAVAEAAREAEGQETTLLEETGILLVGLQKYGPEFLTAVAGAHAAANPGKPLLQCVRATYDSGNFLLARKLLDPAMADARLRDLAARLVRMLASGACVRRELVHQMVMLSESPRLRSALNQLLIEMRGSSLQDLVMHRYSRDCAEVLTSIFATTAADKRKH